MSLSAPFYRRGAVTGSSFLSHGQSFNLCTMSSDEDGKLINSNWPEFPDISPSDVTAKILAVRAPERASK
jgi:hypothetical protein